jgi:RNA polymerase sigma-70 factor (ECF subfamily)
VNSRLPAHELTFVAENVVVALACNGDQQAFGELMKRRHAQIRSLFRRFSGSPTVADDLAQECFLQAWRNLNHLKSTGAFGGWLRRIAVNVWLQHLRSSRAEPIDQTAGDSAHADSGAPTTSAEQLDLAAALLQLQPMARTCIVLFYNEGYTHEEIATATRLPLGTVKSHIARSTIRLRDLLAAYAPC